MWEKHIIADYVFCQDTKNNITIYSMSNQFCIKFFLNNLLIWLYCCSFANIASAAPRCTSRSTRLPWYPPGVRSMLRMLLTSALSTKKIPKVSYFVLHCLVTFTLEFDSSFSPWWWLKSDVITRMVSDLRFVCSSGVWRPGFPMTVRKTKLMF